MTSFESDLPGKDALAKIGAQSAMVKFLQTILSAAGAAVVEVLAAMLAGLALGAVLLAVDAGNACAARALN